MVISSFFCGFFYILIEEWTRSKIWRQLLVIVVHTHNSLRQIQGYYVCFFIVCLYHLSFPSFDQHYLLYIKNTILLLLTVNYGVCVCTLKAHNIYDLLHFFTSTENEKGGKTGAQCGLRLLYKCVSLSDLDNLYFLKHPLNQYGYAYAIP